jgi:hypothetical protein
MMPAEAARRRAVFVVGAGRSGTSAVIRGVAALGVELGSNLKPPTAKNPTGFFEDEDLLRIGKQMRRALGLNAESVALVDDAAWQSPALQALCDEAVETIHRRFGSAEIWGFKYAQTLRYLPFWQRVLERAGVEASWVLAVRNPLSVARSRKKLDPLRGMQEKSDTEWLVGVVPYLRRMLGDPFVAVDYDVLMKDPAAQLERIAVHLALPFGDTQRAGIREFTDEFLIGGMRHTVFDDADLEAAGNPLTVDAYRWLRRLSTDQVQPDDPELLEAWLLIEQSLAAQAPTLRYVDHVVALLREADERGLGGLRVRLKRRLKRVRWVARSYGERKLRRDIEATRAAERDSNS